uniref:Small integral membrane protein 31 n=1 Tax=Anabas testudineus TaxID=64144 RepID=A0A3Q1I5U1_ANATE
MELPFSSFELTFIIVAFVIFSLFSLASVCIQPNETSANDAPEEVHSYAEAKEKRFCHCYYLYYIFNVHMNLLMSFPFGLCCVLPESKKQIES